ncbi:MULTISPECIES: calcium/sodium antiporter [Cetobacterium]|jgi:cation:H+ antiporter|uniref:Calcium/sodium antiporter n=1 Tax=Candidatus Cetobacterium colombiensis TaxID=3073100 RepID=A0ABU4W6M7_9FUSO|nr:calcium/sodium antiporter [Candidatus Cetobacterium colombiensis]MDX8335159.1 calcium/sodium antiporter [Candidatus Cetobacterium colombiensis]
MLSVIILLVGVVFLVFGANFLVDGASVIAKKFNIPNIVIGLTIVAFGTSAPELVVNVISALNGKSAITLGNVIGSNVINILVILGITALIYPLTVGRNTVRFEIPIALFASVLTYVLSKNGILSRVDGFILLGFFILFLMYNTYLTVTNREESELDVKNYTLPIAIGVTILGFILLVFGGKFIVDSAVDLARNFGISERVISVTVVSLGTSLPELATSVVAAFKKNTDIAIGNVVGSNIFNTFFILGISTVIAPIAIPSGAMIDLILNMAAAILLLVFVLRGYKLKRIHGLFFLAIYSAYLYSLFK